MQAGAEPSPERAPDAQLLGEQLRLLYAGLPTALAANLLLGIILAVVQWGTVAPVLIVGWLAAFGLVLLMRAGLMLAEHQSRPHSDARQILWLRGFRAGVLAMGAVWGLAGWLLFPAGNIPHQAFVSFTLAGVVAGAVTSLAADRRSAIVFVLATLLPLITRLSLEGGPVAAGMSLMVSLFLVFVSLSGGRLYENLRENVRLRLSAAAAGTALKESEQRWQFALEGSGDGVWDWNAQSNKVFFSRRWKEMLGYAEHEIGDTLDEWDSRVHPDDKARCYEDLNRHFRGETPMYVNEHRMRCKDGSYKWILDRGKVIERTADGKPLRVIGMHSDITERKSAEQVLRDGASRIRAVVDNVLDGIISIDERGLIESFNPAAERIFGYSADEVLGRNVSLLMPEPHRSRHDAYIAHYTDGGAPRIIGVGREVEGLRKDGTVFPLELAVSEVWLAGRRIFTGVARDITERKKVERLKSEFISTVSHELRTPLTSIRGSLGLLAGGAAGELPAQARQLVDIAHKNSERLSRLINDILDIEKITSGRMHFDLRPHALMPLVEQAVMANQAYAEQYGVRFAITAGIAAGEARVDAERFQQVMANLLSNAAKFSPRGATVEVAVAQRADRLQVAVSDRGPGIPAGFRSRVFEKFSQADASDSRAKGGSGLGLAITREIVEHMDGRISFDTEQGVGTTFRIEFPAWRAAGPAATGPETVGPRLLVVEDDRDVARLLVLMLQKDGFVTDVAHNAEAAKQLLAAHRYEAITLDLMLPGQDGISLIRELRADPATRALPIVVVSAKVEEGRLAINGDFAAIDWLGKPIDEQRLVAAVRSVIGRARDDRPRVLHVEDDDDLHRILASIAGQVAEFDHAGSLREAREKLGRGRYALVVLDLELPDGSGWELLPKLHALDPPPPVIVLSGHDVSVRDAGRVQATLVKSQTGNADLLNTIHRVIRESCPTPG